MEESVCLNGFVEDVQSGVLFLRLNQSLMMLQLLENTDFCVFKDCFVNVVLRKLDSTGESPAQILGAIGGGIGGYALGKLLAKELGLKGAKKSH